MQSSDDNSQNSIIINNKTKRQSQISFSSNVISDNLKQDNIDLSMDQTVSFIDDKWNKIIGMAERNNSIINENSALNKSKMYRQYQKVLKNKSVDINYSSLSYQNSYIKNKSFLKNDDQRPLLISWFLIDKISIFQQTIGDIEILKLKGIYTNILQQNIYPYEAHFGLAQLYLHEGKANQSIYHIHKAVKISQEVKKLDEKYLIYFCLTLLLKSKMIQDDQMNDNKQSFVQHYGQKLSNMCSDYVLSSTVFQKDDEIKNFQTDLSLTRDYNKEKQEINLSYNTLKGIIDKNPQNIEALWMLLEISIKYHAIKQGFICPEPPQEFAVKLKNVNTYYGYLAWSQINLNYLFEIKKGVLILKDLCEKYPSKIEAYISLWNYYYYKQQDYENSLDVAERLFILGTEMDSKSPKIDHTIMYSKSLFKLKKFEYQFDLLQNMFSNHSEYPVLLYKFANSVQKSTSISYYGAAIGALQETIRLSQYYKRGKILYVLGKLYELTLQNYEAYLCFKESQRYIQKDSRVQEIKQFLNFYNGFNQLNNLHSILSQQIISQSVMYTYNGPLVKVIKIIHE